MNIRTRTKEVLQRIGIPVTTFCKKVNISTAAYYRWLNNDLKLSLEKERTIIKYIDMLYEVYNKQEHDKKCY